MLQFIKDEFKRLQQKLLQKQKEVVEVETEIHNLHCNPQSHIKNRINTLINAIERYSIHRGYGHYTGQSFEDAQKLQKARIEIDNLLDDLINYIRKSQ